MKYFSIFSIILILLASLCLAGWEHAETVFDFSAADSVKVGEICPVEGKFTRMNCPHGVVVDPEGKFWIAMCNGTPGKFIFNDEEDWDHDGVTKGDTSWYKPLFVYNADGTEADFGPIKEFTLPNGKKDTLHLYSSYSGAGMGISLTGDGNILYSSYSSIYKFNYKTGECMARYRPEQYNWSRWLTEAVHDENTGLIYHSWLYAEDRPVVMLDEEFNVVGNVVDTLGHITRTLAVRSESDGSNTELFVGTTWDGCGVLKYYSPEWPIDPDKYTGFELVDTLCRWEYCDDENDTSYVAPLWSSSLDFNQDKTKLLVGALRKTWCGPYGSQWYVIDLETGKVESFGVPAPDEAAGNPDMYIKGGVNGPRGGFFVNDSTLYTVDFYLETLDKWVYESESSTKNNEKIAQSFELYQNFPNPFNSTTSIRYYIPGKSKVKLSVFNTKGQLIENLVNTYQSTGIHMLQWNAEDRPSGVYFYKLNADNYTAVKKCILLK
jgi:hypothetical protein